MRNFRDIPRWSRRALVAALLGATAALAACDLDVANPGAVESEKLNEPGYMDLLVNGVVGDYQQAVGWVSLWSGMFTDELRNHHSYFENPEIDRRDVNNNNGTYALSIFNPLHRARFLADSVASRVKAVLADSAGRDLRLARVLAYGGHSWVLLGEQYCSTPINKGAAVTSEQMLQTALQRFDEAITVAAAARAAAANQANATIRSRLINGSDSITNFARVGAARAALDLGDKPKALAYARAVTPAYASEASKGFVFWAHYALDGGAYSRRTSNPHYEFIRSGRWFSVTGTPYENLKDPRVPHSDTLYRSADGTMRTFANSPASFSTYAGKLPGMPIDQASNIRIASALEARYVIAEAEGLSAANLDFVNQRRAIGGQAALGAGTTATEYVAALRDQRARDFYLDGHRMGDIRRYKKLYSTDLWPKGAYFGSATTQYGSQECWPIPLSEEF